MRADEFLDEPSQKQTAESFLDADSFLDAPEPAKPRGFFGQLMQDIAGAFSKPKSVLETAPGPRATPFDFNTASRVARAVDDGVPLPLPDTIEGKQARIATQAAADAEKRAGMNRRRFANENPVLSGAASGSAQALTGVLNAPAAAADLFNQVAVNPILQAAGMQPLQRPTTPGTEALQQLARDYSPAVAQPGLGEAWDGDQFGTWLMSNLAQQSPQMAQSLAAAFVPALRPVLLPSMGAQAMGSSYAQGDDSRIAAAKGLVEVGTEMLPLGVFDRVSAALRSMPGDVQRKVVAEAGRRLLAAGGAITANSITGAIEESIAQVGGNALDRFIGGKDVGLLDDADKAGVLGAAGGSALSLPQAAGTLLQRREPSAEITPTLQDYEALAARVFGRAPQAQAQQQAPAPQPAQQPPAPAPQQPIQPEAVANILGAIERAVPTQPQADAPAAEAFLDAPEQDAQQPESIGQAVAAAAQPAAQISQPAPAVGATVEGAGAAQPPQAAPTPVNTGIERESQANAGAGFQVNSRENGNATGIEREPAIQDDGPLGRDFTPISQGGKPFKTDREAKAARKLQPHLRVLKSKDGKGFILAPKTAKQLAAEAQAAKRIATPRTGNAGKPMSAHEFILGKGGLDGSTRADLVIDGNPRFGNRTLFAGKGKQGLTLAQAAELLAEAGYIKEESERAAADIIKRSITSPQYTPDGWERIAQAEADARFEDFANAQADAGDPLTLDAADLADLQGAEAYDQADLQALIEAAEAEGIDTEDILAQAARITENGTNEDYTREATRRIADARNDAASSRGAAAPARPEQGRPAAERGDSEGGGQGDGRPGDARAAGQDESLTGQAPAATDAAKQPLPIPEEAFAELLEDATSQSEEEGGYIFREPESTVRIEAQAGDFIELDQAEAELEGWKQYAKQQGETGANAGKVVISLFDASGTWAKPWADAGYQVHTFDIQDGVDINDFSVEYLQEQLGLDTVDVILAAPPCTDFSSSGAHAWKKKDADGRTAASVELVRQTLRTVEYFKPTVWSLENPVGRIAKMTGLPKPTLTFQPHNFGDPYTKRTMLWGNMATDLPTANVEPSQGSKVAKLSGTDKYGRSLTPEGFAYAFFMANNLQDLGVAGRASVAFGMPKDVVQQALDAGVPESQVEGVIQDAFYQDLSGSEGAAKELRKLTKQRGGLVREGATAYADQTNTPQFKRWSKGAPVVRLGDDEHVFQGGQPVVVEALHGTTADFTEFKAERANIESDLGGGFYFSNTPEDVGTNYAGKGPDLTNKMELAIERLEQELQDSDEWADKSPEEIRAEAERQARERWMDNDGMTMPVFVRFDNPVVIGGDGSTLLRYQEPYNEELDEYGEPEGELVEFVDALRDVASDYLDADADAAMAKVWEELAGDDTIEAGKLIDMLAQSDGLANATDDNGTLASKEIIRKAFERLGYDGFIDTTAYAKFGPRKMKGPAYGATIIAGMQGMSRETVHFIAFNPTQIKSRLGNSGEFNPDDANILRERGADQGADYGDLGQVDDDTEALVQQYGEPVASLLDAERRMSNGERIFAMHEQAEELGEITSVRQLKAWTPDQLIALNPEAGQVEERQDDLFNQQLDLFLDSKPVETQTGPEVDAARQAAADALRDMRDMGNPLAMALSSDLAARQRVSLVGQTARTPEEFATLAQVYRDPRFETFRVVFTNDAGKVVSQVGMTMRMPGATTAMLGNDVNEYLDKLMEAAHQRGATGYFLLHNHPSGNPTPSRADERLTQAYSARSAFGPVKFKGHVVIDTNKYALIDKNGAWTIEQKDFGQPMPYGDGQWVGEALTGPSDVMRLAKRLQVDNNSVALIVTNYQHTVLGVTSIPASALTTDKARNRLVIARATLGMKGAKVVAVGRNFETLRSTSGMVLDAVQVFSDGTMTSFAKEGLIQGGAEVIDQERGTRITSDTSPEFAYLRAQALKENQDRNKMRAKLAPRARENQGDDYDLDFTQPAGAAQRGAGAGARADAARGQAVQDVQRTVAGTPAARGWARATSLRRADGPIAFYRGASAELTPEHFQLKALGFASGNPSSGLGVWSTEMQDEAATYGPVQKFYLDIRKPKVYRYDELPGFDSKEDAHRFRERLRAQGFDGIVVHGKGLGKPWYHAVAFDPSQVIPEQDGIVREEPPEYGTQEELRMGSANPEKFKLRDLLGFERDAAGRRIWTAGRKGYQAGMDFARSILGKVKLMDTKPGEFRAMMRRFQADNYNAQQRALEIAKAGQGIDPEMRKLLSDIIEKEVAVGDNTPEGLLEIAANMSAAFERQAQELVELGMMKPDRKVANYLPRVYRNPLIGKLQGREQVLGLINKVRMKIRGDRLKSRGLTAQVPPGRVKDMERLGWRLSSMPDGSPVPIDLRTAIEKGRPMPGRFNENQKVVMWRDFTRTEREDMGEVRDAFIRFAMGYVETQKDLAAGRLFKAISENRSLASAFNPGGWVKVSDKEVFGSNGLKVYGALAGMYVEPQVADQLKRAIQDNSAVMQAYDKALSLWKEGKTVWNPVAHGNNIVSNLFMAHFAGINFANPKVWRRALKEYRTKGELYQEAIENGLLGTEFANVEIQNALMPELQEFMSEADVVASRVTKMAEFLKTTGKPVTWYREKMQKAYEFEDQIFKLMVYIDRRQNGASPESAVDDAERYFFNYSDAPEGIRTVQRFWSPFFSYTYKALPALLHTAATRPDRMLLPAALLGGANWLAYSLLGDDGDEEEERKNLPDYMKGNTALGSPKMVRLPANSPEGNPYFLDMSRRIPLGDIFDMNNQMGGLPILQPFMPSHPILWSTPLAILGNRDNFTGRDLVKKSDSEWEAAQKRAGYLYRQIVPNAAFVPGSYAWDKAAQGLASAFDAEFGPYTGFSGQGDKTKPWVAALDVTGVAKVRESDTGRNEQFRMIDLRKESQEIRANMASLGRRLQNKAITQAEYDKQAALQREKLERLRERMQEIRD